MLQRPRTLPFRSSPTSVHTSLFSTRSRNVFNRPPTLTPADSSDDESDIELISPKHCSTLPSSLHLEGNDTDMDTDMMDSQSFASPVWSPKRPPIFASPAHPRIYASTPSARSAHTQTPRLPTPIYGHFAAAALNTPSSLSSNPSLGHYSPAIPTPPSAQQQQIPIVPRCSTIRSSLLDQQQDAFLRRRRLPSPISEDENMDSPTTMTKSMLQNLDMSATPSTATFPLEHSRYQHYEDQTRQQHQADLMTPKTPGFAAGKGWGGFAIPQGPAVENRNRRRSDAISSGGENRAKIVFSMGFRADCEKCRERVPGHYSHVLKS